MEHIAGLLRLTIERSGTIGLLLTIFSGVSLFLGGRYLTLPPLITEWSGVGLVAGLAVLATSLILKFGSSTGKIASTWIEQSAQRQNAEMATQATAAIEAENARENLQTLDRDELEYLYRVLAQGTRRFDVHRVSPGPMLISKDIFREIAQPGPHLWTCELHPALAAQRAQLMAALTERLRISGQTF